MLLYLLIFTLKYLYMSLQQRHIFQQSNIIEVSNATHQQPTNATFISKETMETNAEKECIRQESTVVHAQSKLAENSKAKR